MLNESAERLRNRLIAKLPETSSQEASAAICRSKDLKSSQVLYEFRAPIERVYFPINCVLSCVTIMGDGRCR